MATLQTLISMGFSEKSATRAIEVTGNKGVEEAMEWLLAHADDPKIGQASASGDTTDKTAGDAEKKNEDSGDADMEVTEDGEKPAGGDGETKEEKEAKSIKCDECGKLFKTSEEVEFHAVKSGHSSFSESTQEKAPLTEEQKKQKLLELEEKLKARRKAKAEEEERDAREREKKRIEMGKNVAEIKRKHQEDEIKKLAEEKRREKMEDKMARQRVKAQIEADKEARRQRLAVARGEAPPEPAAAPAATPVSAPAAAAPAAKKSYDEARIQFRLPSGSPVVATFGSKEPLSAVQLWLALHHAPSTPQLDTILSTTFPRKVFTSEEMDMPLDVLGLVPSAVLMVQYK